MLRLTDESNCLSSTRQRKPKHTSSQRGPVEERGVPVLRFELLLYRIAMGFPEESKQSPSLMTVVQNTEKSLSISSGRNMHTLVLDSNSAKLATTFRQCRYSLATLTCIRERGSFVTLSVCLGVFVTRRNTSSWNTSRFLTVHPILSFSNKLDLQQACRATIVISLIHKTDSHAEKGFTVMW